MIIFSDCYETEITRHCSPAMGLHITIAFLFNCSTIICYEFLNLSQSFVFYILYYKQSLLAALLRIPLEMDFINLSQLEW